MSSDDAARGSAEEGGERTQAPAPPRRRRHRRVLRPATNAQAEPAQGQSAEDTPAAWGESDARSDRDQWLREQRPPHWG